MQSDTKRLNQIRIEKDTHDWLLKQANLDGESIGSYVGALLDSWAEDRKPPKKPSLYWDWFKIHQEKRKRDRVYQAMAIYLERPTEDMADRLARMCEMTGLDYAEVQKEVGSDPFSSIVAHSRDGTKFGECLRWLPKFITEHGSAVQVAALYGLAEQKGFAPSMLTRVKAAINRDGDTPSIQSIKVGKGWIWQIEEEQQHEGPP